jgi:hypothetical protein
VHNPVGEAHTQQQQNCKSLHHKRKSKNMAQLFNSVQQHGVVHTPDKKEHAKQHTKQHAKLAVAHDV